MFCLIPIIERDEFNTMEILDKLQVEYKKILNIYCNMNDSRVSAMCSDSEVTLELLQKEVSENGIISYSPLTTITLKNHLDELNQKLVTTQKMLTLLQQYHKIGAGIEVDLFNLHRTLKANSSMYTDMKSLVNKLTVFNNSVFVKGIDSSFLHELKKTTIPFCEFDENVESHIVILFNIFDTLAEQDV